MLPHEISKCSPNGSKNNCFTFRDEVFNVSISKSTQDKLFLQLLQNNTFQPCECTHLSQYSRPGVFSLIAYTSIVAQLISPSILSCFKFIRSNTLLTMANTTYSLLTSN